MTTHYTLDLTEAQLLALGERLTGKKQKATRKQIVAWLDKLATDNLAGRQAGPTELRNIRCPKCSRPIAVQVPTVPKAAAQAPSDVAQKALAAAKALDEAATRLRELAA